MIHHAFAKAQNRLQARIAGFGQDEGGALIIFALLMLTLMLMIGGLALDLMRYETTRVTLQQNLDRCTLTAAALTQQQDPESVVRDCMLKAGLSDQLSAITVTDGSNYRAVKSVGVADTQPFFLHMLGIQDFDAHGVSAAEQGLSNIEIVLVLDVSGSMTGQKIANLKIAANNFVDTVFAQDPSHRVTVTIVPYNAQVNIGPILADKFNTVYRANVADVNCPELPDAAFVNPGIGITTQLPMMAYADIAYGTNYTTNFVSPADVNYAKPNFGASFCKPTTVNVVRLPQTDATTLKSQINALQAGGNTSITLGMKWGMTLLDPAMRSTFSQLVSEGKMPATAEGRPFDYNDSRSMKVIVLMTDGEHVRHNRVNDAYKTGASPIWLASDGNYSVRFETGRPAAAGANEYWVPHLCVSWNCTNGVDTSEAWRATPWTGGSATPAVQQDWANIWSNLKMTYVAWQFYARALGTSSSSRNAVYNAKVADIQSTWKTETQMDDLLEGSCTQAKDNGIIVFGIALEAPTHGQDVIRACATSDAHYYDAASSTINTAFQSIATNITQLKLTQ